MSYKQNTGNIVSAVNCHKLRSQHMYFLLYTNHMTPYAMGNACSTSWQFAAGIYAIGGMPLEIHNNILAISLKIWYEEQFFFFCFWFFEGEIENV